jgi:putative flippase GtrA
VEIIEGTVNEVNYIRDIYARFTVLIHEVAKFAVVGGIGFIVQLGVQDVVHYVVGVGPLTSVVIGYVVATAVTFVGNRHWAFKHRQGKGLRHEGAMFVGLNVVGIGIQLGVVGLVHYGLGLTDPLWYNAATIVGIGLGTLFRLWSYRRWVFLAVPEAPLEAELVDPDTTGPQPSLPIARLGSQPRRSPPPEDYEARIS